MPPCYWQELDRRPLNFRNTKRSKPALDNTNKRRSLDAFCFALLYFATACMRTVKETSDSPASATGLAFSIESMAMPRAIITGCE